MDSCLDYIRPFVPQFACFPTISEPKQALDMAQASCLHVIRRKTRDVEDLVRLDLAYAMLIVFSKQNLLPWADLKPYNRIRCCSQYLGDAHYRKLIHPVLLTVDGFQLV